MASLDGCVATGPHVCMYAGKLASHVWLHVAVGHTCRNRTLLKDMCSPMCVDMCVCVCLGTLAHRVRTSPSCL